MDGAAFDSEKTEKAGLAKCMNGFDAQWITSQRICAKATKR